MTLHINTKHLIVLFVGKHLWLSEEAIQTEFGQACLNNLHGDVNTCSCVYCHCNMCIWCVHLFGVRVLELIIWNLLCACLKRKAFPDFYKQFSFHIKY